jgi:argininosuccinate synthase
MKSPVALAYAGGIRASAAIPWLVETLGLEVVTVTLDVGQGHELAELRARALSCGAMRAHVVDARDEFARDVLFPLLFTPRRDDEHASISSLAWPLIARKLTEIARIEGVGAVAHGSIDPAFDAHIHASDPSLPIIAPAREWTMSDADLLAYARAHRLPVHIPIAPGCQFEENLWGRRIEWEGADEPTAARARVSRSRVNVPALVDIHFERRVPTSLNGVPMSPAELIECLSLIGGQHGIGRTTSSLASRQVLHDAPAATILRAAALEAGESSSTDVCLRLADGQYTVLSANERQSLLVNYA